MDQMHYSMIIQWDSRDNIFVVRFPELAGCVTHGKTYEEAIQQGKDAIESWIMDALTDNTPLPVFSREGSMREGRGRGELFLHAILALLLGNWVLDTSRRGGHNSDWRQSPLWHWPDQKP